MFNRNPHEDLHQTNARLREIRRRLDTLPEHEAQHAYALSTTIERLVNSSGMLGRVALALSSSKIAKRAMEECIEQEKKRKATEGGASNTEEGVPKEREAIDRGDEPSAADTSRADDLLDFLKGLPLAERIETIARDVLEKKDIYRPIDVIQLAKLVGIKEPYTLYDQKRIFIRYLKMLNLDEIYECLGAYPIVRHCTYEKVANVMDRAKYDRFIDNLTNLEDDENEKFHKETTRLSEKQNKIITEITNNGLLSDEWCECSTDIARCCIENKIYNLNFECEVEDGEYFNHLGPYDHRDGKFVNLEGCVTIEW